MPQFFFPENDMYFSAYKKNYVLKKKNTESSKSSFADIF